MEANHSNYHAKQQAIAFIDGHQLLINSDLAHVALAVKRAFAANPLIPVLVFDACNSEVIDLDLRGDDADILARLIPSKPKLMSGASDTHSQEDDAAQRGRGRPKLGVVAREITLLPRHWEWLNQQTGGASVALRKLVEHARRGDESKQQQRVAMDYAYRFMAGIASHQPNYEEVSRALFAGDGERFEKLIVDWPIDVANHLLQLAQAAFA